MTRIGTDISEAVDLLNAGQLVGMPTETVYGLAGDARNPDAVAAIFSTKNRPHFNPLIAHVCDMDMALEQGVFSETAQTLAAKFWPGPLTIVVPVNPTATICDLARAGLETQALRWPSHPTAQNLIKAFGAPLVAPSANKSGRISPTRPDHVANEFSDELAYILDGGPCTHGIESSVVFVEGRTVTLLRAGSITRSDIESLVGPIGSSLEDDHAPRSPGMLSRHYAPDAALRLNVTTPNDDETLLGFGDTRTEATLNLSASGDLTEAASNLYTMLRELDESHDAIAVSPIPDTGIGAAINDRLSRAAKKS